VKPALGSNTGSNVEPVGSNAPKPDDKTIKNGAPKKAPVRVVPKKQVAAAADDKDPKALIKLGKALEKDGEWDQARGVYMKLEKIKGYAGQALYMQAWAAFQNQDTNAAEQLAKKAAEAPGAQKTDAMFLYADALFRKGELERAKKLYITMRGKVTGEQRATATKKIAACNKALKLPEADGIVN
jgi:TolA-binding protein